jgi:hypothetical protein
MSVTRSNEDWQRPEFQRPAKRGDFVHDIYVGFATLLFRWRGAWHAKPMGKWRIRRLTRFHNCTVTGIY